MAGGLVGLLDDVAALAKLAAASVDDVGAAAGRASLKTAGVVVDDAAVTPGYVQGLAAERELPIIRRIAVGSLRNKLLVILPAALVLSAIAPTVVEVVLMFGGSFLAYEGAHKVLHALRHRRDGHGGSHHPHGDPVDCRPVDSRPDASDPVDSRPDASHPDVRPGDGNHPDVPAVALGEDAEAATVRGAIRTDFILSAEIMVIALKEVIDEPVVSRGVILAVVGVAITVAVYGVVALIVKMDDLGLRLAQRSSPRSRRAGLALVQGMPTLLAWLSVIGTAAMLWVGGHILLVGFDELGWSTPYHLVHQLESLAHGVSGVGGLLGWLVATAASAVVGLAVGSVLVAVVARLPFGSATSH